MGAAAGNGPASPPGAADKPTRSIGLWLAAGLVGLVAATSVVLFRRLIDAVEWLGSGHTGSLVATALAMPPWQRVLIPTLGGLLAGLALQYGQHWAARGPAGTRNIDYLDAARAGSHRLNDRTTLTRAASALLSVGTGASIGREGPMVQLAAWLSTWVARLLPLGEAQRGGLLVCGIAAGIGAAYHAPIAGVVFVLELALGFLTRHTAAPVLVAGASASALIYWLVEPRPLYPMATWPLLPGSLALAVAVGVVAGGLGWALLGGIERTRRRFERLAAPSLRLGLGGLLVGLVSVAVPQVWGNGYSVVSHLLSVDSPWQWVAMILLAKVLATLLSAGSGAIGGVLTPSLLVGAGTGYLCGLAGDLLFPATLGGPHAAAVTGMAAMLAAVTHAPLTAIVMVLEMTGQYQLTLPVMVACGLAHAVSAGFGTRPLYGNPIEGRP